MTTKSIELKEYVEEGQIPPSLINSVKQAVDSTFKSMLNNAPAYHGTDTITKLDSFDGIIGVISFVGDLSWSLSMGFHKEMSIMIAKTYFGMDIDYLSEDMGDVVGEFVNILAGDVVARLDAIDFKAEMSIPTVTRGYNIELLFSEKLPIKQMLFNHSGGDFWIKLAIDKHDNRQLPKSKNTYEGNEMAHETTVKTAHITASQIDCVKQAIITTFNSICEEEPQYIETKENGTTFDGIVGIISFVGEEKTFSLMLGFSRQSAIDIGFKFAGFEIDYNSEDMGDVIGELANVVGGDVIARLDAIGMKADLSIPTIARGHEMQMLLSHNVSSFKMNYSLSIGDFWVKLATLKD